MAERGPMERTPSRRFRGLTTSRVNLLSNIIYERYEQLTTCHLRKEHNVLQRPNLANSLTRINSFRYKKGRKPTKEQGKNSEVRKADMF
jgi:hypothetical protein